MGASWLHQRLSLLRKAGHCPLLQLPWSLLIAAGGDTIHSVGVSLPAPGDTVVMRASSSHLLWSWWSWCLFQDTRQEGGWLPITAHVPVLVSLLCSMSHRVRWSPAIAFPTTVGPTSPATCPIPSIWFPSRDILQRSHEVSGIILKCTIPGFWC